jgi:hypothetical protein
MATSRALHRVGWVGMAVVGAFLLFAVAADLSSDRSAGLPADHEGAFTVLSGQTFQTVRSTNPGVAGFVTALEVGYALHELTFAVLFLAVVLIPLRQGHRWAWWACWAVMIADLGYTLTLARHDSAILSRSLVAVIAVPVLLALCAPAVFRNSSRRLADA